MNNPEEVFHSEVEELLADLENALLDLEETPDEPELVNRAFRAMHTIKGSGSMFGYKEMARFTHQLEDTFDRVRQGDMYVSKPLISLTLKAKDHLQFLLNESKDEPNEVTDLLLEELSKISGANDTTIVAPPKPIKPPAEKQTYHIAITPSKDALNNGMDPLNLLRELNDLGICVITTFTDALPTSLADYEPMDLLLSWRITLETDQSRESIDDVFIFVIDDWDINVENITVEHHEDIPKLGKILHESGDVEEAQIEELLAEKPRVGELLVEQGMVSEEQVEAALAQQKVQKKSVDEKSIRDLGAAVKVPAAKLDHLMDIVGELVITQARLQQLSLRTHNFELDAITESFERLSSELRDNTLSMRMLPLGNTFSSFKRLIRDLSQELKKEVKLVTLGEDTELDKTLIDHLSEPLIHLLRNSIDHGLESPEIRAEIGKNPEGTITLEADHQDSIVMIKVSDDGSGIDPAKIREKAIEKNIIRETDILSKRQTLDLIFSPGFSTAETISDISGRGVGMDAVKSTVESMGGKIYLESEVGEGTTTIIELPLTLAIIDGLLVKIGNEPYVLPLNAVEECVEVQSDELRNQVSELLEVRGNLIPQISIRHWFDIKGNPPPIQQTIITRFKQQKLGIIVDEVIGEHQTVIKSLGPAFRAINGVSGATILGGGEIALILDVPKLADQISEVNHYDNNTLNNHLTIH